MSTVETLAVLVGVIVGLLVSVLVLRLGVAPLVREVREMRIMFQVDRDLDDT